MTSRALVVAAVMALAGGCGGRAAPAPVIPHRPATPGDALIALAPAGADIVVEIDVKRLRTNPVVGRLVETLGSDPRASAHRPELRLIDRVDTVVVCSYGVGTDTAATVEIVRGNHIASIPHATPIGPHTAVVGPPEWVARVEAVASGQGKPLSAPSRLMVVRQAAMPPQAPGASLRLSAYLDFDGRVGLANLFHLSAVPVSISVWGDVVDDLAVVAVLGGKNRDGAERLAHAAVQFRHRLAKAPVVRALGLSPLVKRMRIRRIGRHVRLVFLINPDYLKVAVGRAERALAIPPPQG